MLLRWLNETRRGEMVFTEWMIASQVRSQLLFICCSVIADITHRASRMESMSEAQGKLGMSAILRIEDVLLEWFWIQGGQCVPYNALFASEERVSPSFLSLQLLA